MREVLTSSIKVHHVGKIKDFFKDRLSKLADVTYNTIIKIESGVNTNSTIETLSKIAKALGVSVDDLIK